MAGAIGGAGATRFPLLTGTSHLSRLWRQSDFALFPSEWGLSPSTGAAAPRALRAAPWAAVLTVALSLAVAGRAGADEAVPASAGYRLVAADGGVFAFGRAAYRGSAAALGLRRPVVAMAGTPSGQGYWLATSDGGVFAFGDAGFFGSAARLRLKQPVVAMAATPSGQGYWLVASDGGVFAFGDAVFRGSTGAIALNRPVVGVAATPSGRGYWLVASDGGVFAFGDAVFRGSTGAIALNRPVVGLAATPSGRGYWLVASDGGVFAFGAAPFLGSMGATPLNRPIVATAASPRGLGYWLVASDGGVFTFGDAAFAGSMGGQRLRAPVVGVSAPPVRTAPEVLTFFYPWYARPDVDDTWRHWEANARVPPADVASDFYPLRGAYSSSDPAVLDAQMAEIAAAGIDAVASSWWGRGSFEDGVLPAVIRAASAHGVRVNVSVAPYVGRSPASVARDLAHLRSLGVRDFWVFNANGPPASAWAAVTAGLGPDVRVMAQSGNIASVRSGAWAEYARAAGFDGIYTYDAVRHPPSDFAVVCGAAREHRLLCSPSVAPGYVATRGKPRDTQFVPRDGGARYDAQWAGALAAGGDIVSITSYNEWHEGTQIEPAVPYCFPDGMCSPGYEGSYGVFGPAAASVYLDRTRHWSALFRRP